MRKELTDLLALANKGIQKIDKKPVDTLTFLIEHCDQIDDYLARGCPATKLDELLNRALAQIKVTWKVEDGEILALLPKARKESARLKKEREEILEKAKELQKQKPQEVKKEKALKMKKADALPEIANETNQDSPSKAAVQETQQKEKPMNNTEAPGLSAIFAVKK